MPERPAWVASPRRVKLTGGDQRGWIERGDPKLARMAHPGLALVRDQSRLRRVEPVQLAVEHPHHRCRVVIQGLVLLAKPVALPPHAHDHVTYSPTALLARPFRPGVLIAALAAAAACLAGAAVGGAAAPARITLRVTQAHSAASQSVVSVRMSTTADANNTQATVFVQSGDTACQADPVRLWPRGSAQLLFGWTPYPVRRWDPVVSFVETRAQRLTVCGYEVSEEARRFNDPYVQAKARAAIAVKPPRPGAPVPGAGPWRDCPASPKQRLLRLQSTGSTPGACQRATAIYDAWNDVFSRQAGAPRDNWSSGWQRPGGMPIRVTYPPLRFSRLVVPALHRALACRETAVGSKPLSPLDVVCGSGRFRFGLGA